MGLGPGVFFRKKFSIFGNTEEKTAAVKGDLKRLILLSYEEKSPNLALLSKKFSKNIIVYR